MMSLLIFMLLNIGIELQPNANFQLINPKAKSSVLEVKNVEKDNYVVSEGQSQRVKAVYDAQTQVLKSWFVHNGVPNEEAVEFSFQEHFQPVKFDPQKTFKLQSLEDKKAYILISPLKDGQYKIQFFEGSSKPKQEFTLKYVK